MKKDDYNVTGQTIKQDKYKFTKLILGILITFSFIGLGAAIATNNTDAVIIIMVVFVWIYGELNNIQVLERIDELQGGE